MKRVLLLTVLITVSLHAALSMQMQSGWQLVGIPTGMKDVSLLNRSEVELVWAYDTEAAAWNGYSPDTNLSAKIAEAGYSQLDTLLPYQAVWIKSARAWTFEMPQGSGSSEIENAALILHKGWNLVALPQRSVVSPELFGDAVVWKYRDGWKGYGVGDVSFPDIETIATSEGIWVKSESERTIDLARESSKLHNFDEEATMLAYIRTMIEQYGHSYYGYYGYWGPPPSDLSGEPLPTDTSGSTDQIAGDGEVSDATTTNLQEAGVEESDIFKHDGNHIFYVDEANHQIIVTSFEKVVNGDAQPLATIDLQQNQSVQAMYLYNSRLVLVTQSTTYYIMEGDLAVSSIMPPQNSVSTYQLDILDVSDVLSITKTASHVLEGNFQQSRMIGGRLYLVSRFSPLIEYEYPRIYQSAECESATAELAALDCYEYIEHNCTEIGVVPPDASGASAEWQSGGILPGDGGVTSCMYWETVVKDQACVDHETELLSLLKTDCYGYYSVDENGSKYKLDYENGYAVSETLIPSIVSNATKAALVTPQRFYAPYKLDQRSDITTISAFDVETGSYDESISFLGNTHLYYASADSIYLVSSEYPLYYDFENYLQQQTIYKFSLGETLAYRAKGSVTGTMLNQFSMSDQAGILRVATTTGSSWSPTGTQNSVFALQESDEALSVVGTLSGLGKKGETIQAVRFIGDRGFVVTFRRTDPLYTIDLSDPADIKKVGELSIPGYSEYFHPISEEQILSIGRDADENGRALGLQIQLFDISDFANPKLSAKVLIGDSSTYSEAENNHKAFIYRSSDKTFGFPYRSYKEGYSEHFGIYRVVGEEISALKTFTSENANWSYGQSRGVIFDYDALTYGAMFKGEHILSDTIE